MNAQQFHETLTALDEWHPSAFEKEFSRFVAKTREEIPLPTLTLVEPLKKPWAEMSSAERAQAKKAFRDKRYYEEQVERRYLAVVEHFIRKTELERPDSTTLAWRVLELQEVGWLSRGKWTLKRYQSKRGAHWAVVARQ